MNCCNRVRGGLAAVSLCLRSRPCFGIGADSRRGLPQPGDNFLLYAR